MFLAKVILIFSIFIYVAKGHKIAWLDFKNCQIDIIRFPELDDKFAHPDSIATTIFAFNAIDSKQVQKTWIQRRHNCYLIWVNSQTSENGGAEITQSYNWLWDCSKRAYKTCYNKFMWFITYSGAIAFGHWPRNLPFYHIGLQTNDSILITAYGRGPCFGGAATFHSRIIDLSTLTNVYAAMLLCCCEILWMWTKDPTGFFAYLPISDQNLDIWTNQKMIPDTIIRYIVEPINSMSTSPTPANFTLLHPTSKQEFFVSWEYSRNKASRNRYRNLIAYGSTLNNYVKTHFVTFNFITCDGIQPAFLDLAMLAQPFRYELWLCLFVTSAVTSILLGYVFHKAKLPDNYAMFVYTIFAEQNLLSSSKLVNLRSYKLFTTSFLVAGVVLTNSFRGKLTVSMTTTPPVLKLEKVWEAVMNNYIILVGMSKDTDGFHPGSGFLNPNTNEIPAHEIISANIELVEQVKDVHDQNLNNQSVAKLLLALRVYTYTAEFNRSYAYELLLCNKSMIVGSKKTLDRMYSELIAFPNAEKLYYGKDKFLNDTKTFQFEHMEWDRFDLLYKRFHVIIQSHILEWSTNTWGNLIVHTKNQRLHERKEIAKNSFAKLRNKSNLLLSTYFVFGLGSAICLFAFTIESVYWLALQIKKNNTLSRKVSI